MSLFTLLAAAGVVQSALSCAENDATADLTPDAGDLPETGGPLPPPPRCEAGTWCPVDLPPSPVSLNAIWGSGPDDVWIVGSPDATFHWDGAHLGYGKVDTKQSIFGVWGSGKSDVWAFSTSHSVWHSGGFASGDAGWSRASETTGLNDGGFPTPVFAMWGQSASDVWAVGASLEGYQTGALLPSVLHCDGWNDGAPVWEPSPTSFADPPAIEEVSFNAICGGASTGIWIVGGGGKTRHTTGWKDGGAAWAPLNSGTSRNLYALWCSPSGDVWAAGEAGTMRHFTREGDDYVSAAFDLHVTTSIRALWGSAADDVWAVGDAGTILHWNGEAWSSADTTVEDLGKDDLFAIWGSSKSDLWIAGRSVLLHNGNALAPETSP